ncbi:MAG TPA: YSC84-related protein [Steroidobacteraceae bacterium]|nr:YSC84-related protein [Steroidobacteraceae bacterium]
MHQLVKRSCILMFLLLSAGAVMADEYDEAIKVFKDAGESGELFKSAYGYAVFPTIGKGGIGIGGAHGSGRVYAQGKHVGNTKMTQLTYGLQLGGQAFSQIIFFENKATFDQFTSGNFEFGAQASAVAITAGASAGATTTGTTAGASAGQHDATTSGKYNKGMATFTVAKGGLMYEATLGGQKFSYEPV